MKKIFFSIVILVTFFINVATAQLIPLVQLWNGQRADNFLAANNDGNRFAQQIDYDFVRSEGYASTTGGAGLKPMTLLWNDRNDNFTTATESRIQHAVGVGYKNVGVQCYIWENPGEGLIPLKLFWSADRTDNYTTASSKGEEDAISAGYIFAGIEGYIKESAVSATVVPYNLWKYYFESIVTSNSLFKINNYTSKEFEYKADNTFKYYKPNDVRVRIGSGRGRFEKLYDLKPLRFDPLTVYVKDVEGSVSSIEPSGNRLKITVDFESDDIEIATNCIDNLGCGGIGNPNFHLDNMKLIFFVEPYAENGQIRLRNMESQLTGNLRHDGFNFVVAHLEPFIPFINNNVFEMFSNHINQFLNNPNNINQLNQSMNNAIASGSVLGLSSPYFLSFGLQSNGDIRYTLR